MEQLQFGRHIIIAGLIIVLVGVIWLLFNKHFQWLGNLPGDLKWNNGNTKIYIPITTMLLISLLINICFWLYKYLSK